jgi:hypothetical protein
MNFMRLLSHRYGRLDLDPRRKEKGNKNPKEKSDFFFSMLLASAP